MIGFLCSSQNIYPQIRVVSFDDRMNPSPSLLVKNGENYFDDYDNVKKSVRWGDYSGISRNFAATEPTAWMAGEYGRIDKKRGTWISEISGIITKVNNPVDNNSSPNIPYYSLYPNPGYNLVNFSFILNERSKIEIRIFDILGRMIKLLYKDIAQKGENRLMFNLFALNSGTYFMQITSNGKTIKTEKLVVVK